MEELEAPLSDPVCIGVREQGVLVEHDKKQDQDEEQEENKKEEQPKSQLPDLSMIISGCGALPVTVAGRLIGITASPTKHVRLKCLVVTDTGRVPNPI